jgi:citrate synthase
MLRTEPLPTLEKPEISDGKTMSTSTITKGLEGVVAASSGVCYIDGDAGVLAYRGIDIHELAEKSTFEETCYLLWFGRLPKAAELADLKQKLGAERKLDPAIYDMMRQVPKTATPMEVLRTAVSALSFYDTEA